MAGQARPRQETDAAAVLSRQAQEGQQQARRAAGKGVTAKRVGPVGRPVTAKVTSCQLVWRTPSRQLGGASTKRWGAKIKS